MNECRRRGDDRKTERVGPGEIKYKLVLWL